MSAPSNAQFIAELQAATLAIRLFGLEALPRVLVTQPDRAPPAAAPGSHASRQGA